MLFEKMKIFERVGTDASILTDELSVVSVIVHPVLPAASLYDTANATVHEVVVLSTTMLPE